MPTAIAASTIVAQAFRYMEASPISSFDDDSEQAQAATEQYTNALHQCLEAADWSFASQLKFLPPLTLPGTVAADPDLPYSYELPGGLLRIHEVGDAFTLWRRDAEALRADHPGPLRIRYTADVTNEAALPATFRDAVSLRLATLLGPRWLTTQSKLAELADRFQRTLKQAMRQDGNNASSSRYDDGPAGGDWVSEARR